jgi:hypothetical protein
MIREGFLVALVAAAGCAGRQLAKTYVAPTDQTIVTSTEEAQGPAPAHTVHVSNLSTVPVTVNSYTIRQCENIKQHCDSPQKREIHLKPGSRVYLSRVEPRDSDKGFGYAITFSWRADSSSAKAISTLAEAGVEPARVELVAMQRAATARAAEVGVRDEELETAEIEALGARVASLRMEPDSLVIAVNDMVSLDKVHLLLIGANGERLGRARQIRWRMRPGAARFAPPDSLIGVQPGRTVAEFMLPPGVHSPANTPTQSATLTIIVPR